MARQVRPASLPCATLISVCPQRRPLDQDWDVHFTSDNIKIIALYLWSEADSYGRHPLFLSEEQRRNGTVTIPAGLLKKAGALQVWLIGEHRLGRLKVRKDVLMVK